MKFSCVKILCSFALTKSFLFLALRLLAINCLPPRGNKSRQAARPIMHLNEVNMPRYVLAVLYSTFFISE